MKIKIEKNGKEIVLETKVTATSPAYGAGKYWLVTYSLNTETVYQCASGISHEPPSAIAALDWDREQWDDSVPVERWTDSKTGKLKRGDYITRKNREWLSLALDKIVLE